MKHDQKDGRQEFKRFKKKKAIDIGPTLVLDQERCVLCDRCARFLREWAGDEQLYIAGRGHTAFLTPFPGKPVDNAYSLNTVDLCPVGALTSKDFRFSTPTWFLKRTPSTCVSCARGCSIEVDSKDQTVHRLRPRYNADVNGYWMCDEGRLNYKFVNTDRVKHAVVDRGGEKLEASVESATKELSSVLGLTEDSAAKDRPLVVLASATCTLEEMYLLKKLAAERPKSEFYVARHVPDGVEDDLLRRADRHPNAKGAELLGITLADFREGATSIDVPDGAVLFAVGFDYGIDEPLTDFFARFRQTALIASCENDVMALAGVLLPGLTFAEKAGLIVNFEGHIQQLAPALDNLWDRTAPWELIAELISLATGEGRMDTIAGVRSSLGKDETAFSAVDLNAVGPAGVRLAAQAV
jgi:NADH-quinone oxidoreductase subunit G